MPYSRNVKTYGKSNDLLKINNISSVLFQAKAKGKRHKKLQLKTLPTRTESYLTDDSLQVQTEDTFDRLLHGKNYNDVDVEGTFSKIHSSSDSDFSKSKVVTHNSFHLIPKKTRKQREKKLKIPKVSIKISPDKSISVSNKITTSLDKSINVSLSIEKIRDMPTFSSLSYIKIPKDMGETSVERLFFDTFRERQAIHSSTPLQTIQTGKMIADPLSPIALNQTTPVKPEIEAIENLDESIPKFITLRRRMVKRNLSGFLERNCRKNSNSLKCIQTEISEDLFSDSSNVDVIQKENESQPLLKRRIFYSNSDKSQTNKSKSKIETNEIGDKNDFSNFDNSLKSRKHSELTEENELMDEINSKSNKENKCLSDQIDEIIIVSDDSLEDCNIEKNTTENSPKYSKIDSSTKDMKLKIKLEKTRNSEIITIFEESLKNSTQESLIDKLELGDNNSHISADMCNKENVTKRTPKYTEISRKNNSEEIPKNITETVGSSNFYINKKRSLHLQTKNIVSDGNLTIANNNTNCPEINKSAISLDIIEDSQTSPIKDRSTKESLENLTKDTFILPKSEKLKKIMKPGKSYRRSFYITRKSIVPINQNNTKNETLNMIKGAFKPSLNSISQQSSILESFLSSVGYVSEYPENINTANNSNLEFGIRNITLNNCVKLPQELSFFDNCITAKDIVLRRCGQTEIIPFGECYPESVLENCQKIGEGVFGEVFLYRNQEGSTSVVKIIPIEGNQIINGEKQKKFGEILSEIVIAMELSNLRLNTTNQTNLYNEVKQIKCVQGQYPSRLIELWDLYEETRGSENDSPTIFDSNQLFIILELANGGKNLEGFVFNNARQALSVFKQTALALAVAEEQLKFEHRDLHWGNILVTEVERNKKIKFKLNGCNIEVASEGIEISIIDFTLSRIDYDGVTIFNDLSCDEDLFSAEGDYQFEIYRLVQKHNGNEWQRFCPYSNILWLHYILDKAIYALRYKNVKTKTHKEFIEKLKKIEKEILSFQSASEFVMCKFL